MLFSGSVAISRLAGAMAALFLALGLPLAAIADEANRNVEVSLNLKWESSGGHRGWEQLIAFSKDGKLAYFKTYYTGIIARDTTTWKKVETPPIDEKQFGTNKSGNVVADRDGRRAYSNYDYDFENKKAGLWYVAFGGMKREAHQSQPLLLFSHDGKSLISASSDALIVWDAETLQRRLTLGSVNTEPKSLVLSPDGQTLGVTCGVVEVKEDQIWDLKTGKRKVALGGNYSQVRSLAFSPNGKTLVSRGSDPQVRFWDTATGLNTMSIPLEHNQPTSPVVFSKAGQRVATGLGSSVLLFDAQTGRLMQTLKEHSSRVNSVAFSPDGKQLASVSGQLPSWTLEGVVPGQPSEVIIWDAEIGKAKQVWKPHSLGTYSVAWSADGTRLATGGGSEKDFNRDKKKDAPQVIFLWEVKTGKLVKSFPADEGYQVLQLALSPDGKRLVHNGLDGSRVHIIDIETGKVVHDIHCSTAAIAFSHDGKLLALVSGTGGLEKRGRIELWDPNTGRLLVRHFAHLEEITSVAFHPNGRSLATGGRDSLIRYWDIVPTDKK